jgi:hypothetical protein
MFTIGDVLQYKYENAIDSPPCATREEHAREHAKTLAVQSQYSIDVSRIRKQLCGSDYIPADFSGDFPVIAVYDRGDNFVGCFHIVVRLQPSEHRNPSMHRILVQCDCGRLVPIGRLLQHKH